MVYPLARLCCCTTSFATRPTGTGCRSIVTATLAGSLWMSLPARLIRARDEPLARDLIAHEVRFTQVLSPLLPAAATASRIMG